MWGWRKWIGRRQPADDIGAECEAFLHGSYAEYLASHGQDIPSWAWLNPLAHGTKGQITALADGTSAWHESVAGGTAWYQAMAFLAIETLELAESTGRPLEELQNSILAPLELDLARDVHRRRFAPKEVVGRTVAALHQRPSDRRSE